MCVWNFDVNSFCHSFFTFKFYFSIYLYFIYREQEVTWLDYI